MPGLSTYKIDMNALGREDATLGQKLLAATALSSPALQLLGTRQGAVFQSQLVDELIPGYAYMVGAIGDAGYAAYQEIEAYRGGYEYDFFSEFGRETSFAATFNRNTAEFLAPVKTLLGVDGVEFKHLDEYRADFVQQNGWSQEGENYQTRYNELLAQGLSPQQAQAEIRSTIDDAFQTWAKENNVGQGNRGWDYRISSDEEFRSMDNATDAANIAGTFLDPLLIRGALVKGGQSASRLGRTVDAIDTPLGFTDMGLMIPSTVLSNPDATADIITHVLDTENFLQTPQSIMQTQLGLNRQQYTQIDQTTLGEAEEGKEVYALEINGTLDDETKQRFIEQSTEAVRIREALYAFNPKDEQAAPTARLEAGRAVLDLELRFNELMRRYVNGDKESFKSSVTQSDLVVIQTWLDGSDATNIIEEHGLGEDAKEETLQVLEELKSEPSIRAVYEDSPSTSTKFKDAAEPDPETKATIERTFRSTKDIKADIEEQDIKIDKSKNAFEHLKDGEFREAASESAEWVSEQASSLASGAKNLSRNVLGDWSPW